MTAPTKLNRKTVQRFIKEGHITGTTTLALAQSLVAHMGLEHCCVGAAQELIKEHLRRGRVVLDDAVLRVTSAEERSALQEARFKEHTTRQAIRKRTAAVRGGGHRHNPCAGLLTDDMADQFAYGSWAANGLGQPAPALM